MKRDPFANELKVNYEEREATDDSRFQDKWRYIYQDEDTEGGLSVGDVKIKHLVLYKLSLRQQVWSSGAR